MGLFAIFLFKSRQGDFIRILMGSIYIYTYTCIPIYIYIYLTTYGYVMRRYQVVISYSLRTDRDGPLSECRFTSYSNGDFQIIRGDLS